MSDALDPAAEAGFVTEGEDVRATACADGPVLVRGADRVVDASGVVHDVPRPVVALCTCERTQRQPWCDGTHKAVRRAARRRGDTSSA